MSSLVTSLATLSKNGSTGIIEINNPPVNASSQKVRQGMMECLRLVAEDKAITSVVLTCAGRTFMAGADISEFDLPELPRPDYNEVHAVMEALGKPIVAALFGTVLGGGLELSLSCQARVALASTKLGLPEVKLGLLPGSGGTQRLPRLIGLAPAIDFMTAGNPVSAAQALKMGFIDKVVDDGLLEQATAMAQALAEKQAAGEPLRVTSKLPIDKASGTPAFFEEYRNKQAPLAKGGSAARQIVRCVEAACEQSFEDGIIFERTAFIDRKNSADSRALRHLFFAEREATRIPGLAAGMELRPIRKVGVVGAGTMGGGIAMNFLNAGIPVTIIDLNQEALQRGLGIVRKNYEASAAKGRLTADQVTQRLGLFHGALDMAELGDCDLVIEAAFESLEIKKSVCKQLGAVCKPGAIIASNTSTLDIDLLAEVSGRPADFLGMHFFSPANVMRLLEVVRGAKTDPQVLATVMAIAKKIGKSAVVSGVCFGFIGNRMLEGYLREAELLLLEGASPAQIDGAIEAIGMAMGPHRMIDMAGVDVAAKVVIEQDKAGALPNDPSYRVVVRKLNELGRHGQKTSAGYYRYQGRTAIEDDAVWKVCEELAQKYGVKRRDNISDKEIVERCLYPLINEGARILEEGIAYRPGDVDVVWAQGYGFPAYKGGPMQWADEIGPAVICAALEGYGRQFGNAHGYWTPSPLLAKLATQHRHFSDLP